MIGPDSERLATVTLSFLAMPGDPVLGATSERLCGSGPRSCSRPGTLISAARSAAGSGVHVILVGADR